MLLPGTCVIPSKAMTHGSFRPVFMRVLVPVSPLNVLVVCRTCPLSRSLRPSRHLANTFPNSRDAIRTSARASPTHELSNTILIREVLGA